MSDGTWTRYETATGRIQCTMDMDSDNLPLMIGDGFDVIEGEADGNTHYVADGAFTARPKITTVLERTITANGVHETTIGTVPAGTVLTMSGKLAGDEVLAPTEALFEIEQAMVFRSADAGVYRLEFQPPWPFQEQVVMVIANAD